MKLRPAIVVRMLVQALVTEHGEGAVAVAQMMMGRGRMAVLQLVITKARVAVAQALLMMMEHDRADVAVQLAMMVVGHVSELMAMEMARGRVMMTMELDRIFGVRMMERDRVAEVTVMGCDGVAVVQTALMMVIKHC